MAQEAILTLRVEPSFSEPFEVSVELHSTDDGGRLTATNKGYGALQPQERDLSGDEAEHIRQLLDGLRIRGVSPAAMGLDGTSYCLRIASYPLALELRWWEEPPRSWGGVVDIVRTLTDLRLRCRDA